MRMGLESVRDRRDALDIFKKSCLTSILLIATKGHWCSVSGGLLGFLLIIVQL